MESDNRKRILSVSLILNLILVVWMISSNPNNHIESLRKQNKEIRKENLLLAEFVDSLIVEKQQDKGIIQVLRSDLKSEKQVNDSLKTRLNKRKRIYIDAKNSSYKDISDSTLLRDLSRIRFDPNNL